MLFSVQIVRTKAAPGPGSSTRLRSASSRYLLRAGSQGRSGRGIDLAAARIARNRALIADADKLKLSPVKIGGLWEQIASDYQDLGEFADSEAAYNRSLALLEPENSAQMAYAVTLGNLGSLYSMTRNYDAAENCTRRSLAVLEKLGDPLMIVRAQGHLADVYLAMGRNKDALRYSSLAVQGVGTLAGATSDDKGSILISFAYASCLTSHCDDGLLAAREAMVSYARHMLRSRFRPARRMSR